ncbi:hypothetical protein [Mitsuokella sp. oral taxon 131]|uniref:hypothetical protein n=1 Tax=Mitsuokella sp. oral taxon 131 TaxID=1321780 RepID=UPI00058EBE7C|nr:hypothetical protein [Mitsuokella sp. oral taxon 131]
MFTNWTSKKTQAAVICGLVLGVCAPLVAMGIASHRANAAVMVIDEKNIAEAVKTAIQTANILTTEQKELALKILDAKKLDWGLLEELGKKQKSAGDFCEHPDIPFEVAKKNGQSPAILNSTSSPVEIFRNEIGSIEAVLDRKATLVDLYHETAKNHKALDATYQAAAQRAKDSQTVTKQMNDTVLTAVDAANHAEGEQQLLQAGIQISAAQALQAADTKELIAQMLAMESEKWYVDNREKASRETREQVMKDKAAKFSGMPVD